MNLPFNPNDDIIETDPIVEPQDMVDEYEDEAFDYEDRNSKRRRIGMFCFHCNRKEGHFLAHQHRWFYSFLVGMTFGLIRFIGPYQCQCCGAPRLMSSNSTNPRYLARVMRDRRKASTRRRY